VSTRAMEVKTVGAIRDDETVAALLRENGRLSRQLFRRRMKALELTAAEARAMMYIGANPGIAQARLAELLDVQPIALTRVVDGLEAATLAERRLQDGDRRLRLHETHDTLNRAITSRLSDEDLAHFAAALAGVNAALRQLP
jgi:MarR family transcriptional regulator for hemolysin